MSARDEFPDHGPILSEGLLKLRIADYGAMCDRMDTLTAENARLMTDNQALYASRLELRQALTVWKMGIGTYFEDETFAQLFRAVPDDCWGLAP